MFKGVFQDMQLWHTLLWSVQYLPLLSLTSLPPITPFFKAFKTHPYILNLHICDITDALSFSFPFPHSLSSIEHCYKHVLHLSLYMIMLAFVYTFIFGSIFHIWERTCSFSVSDPGLLHLTWCPPVASIYLQTTCHYSVWLSNTPLCICTTISWSIYQLQSTWVVSKPWLLWIVLQWTLV
jgi:hypothetical protein